MKIILFPEGTLFPPYYLRLQSFSQYKLCHFPNRQLFQCQPDQDYSAGLLIKETLASQTGVDLAKNLGGGVQVVDRSTSD